MKNNFAYFFRIVVKILIPVSFFLIALFPKTYWLAGVMLIITIFYYTLVWMKMGDTKVPKL